MTELEKIMFKKNYPLLEIQRMLIDLAANLESAEKYELSSAISEISMKLDESIYSEIFKHYDEEYSKKHHKYVIIYSVVVKTGNKDCRKVTDELIQYI